MPVLPKCFIYHIVVCYMYTYIYIVCGYSKVECVYIDYYNACAITVTLSLLLVTAEHDCC